MASTTALPPPTSLNQTRSRPASSAGCFCDKACAGQFTCRLCLLQGLCRSVHLPAVFYYKACAGQFTCRLCFTTRPVPVSCTTGLFCYNGLVLPCHALSAWLCLGPMPARPSLHLPHFVHYHVRQDHRASCRDCPVGSRNTGLHWRPVHRFVCLRQCPFGVLQGLPCRQPQHGTALVQPATFPVTCIIP